MNWMEKTMTLQKHLQFNNTEFEVQYKCEWNAIVFAKKKTQEN